MKFSRYFKILVLTEKSIFILSENADDMLPICCFCYSSQSEKDNSRQTQNINSSFFLKISKCYFELQNIFSQGQLNRTQFVFAWCCIYWMLSVEYSRHRTRSQKISKFQILHVFHKYFFGLKFHISIISSAEFDQYSHAFIY